MFPGPPLLARGRLSIALGSRWRRPVIPPPPVWPVFLLSIMGIGLSLLPRASVAQSVAVDGIVAGRAIAAFGRPTWLEGEYGRLSEGAEAPGERDAHFRGLAHLGLDWKPGERFRIHVHGVARMEPGTYGGDPAGVTEVFTQFREEMSPGTSIRFRAGTLFPGTSRENTQPIWSSPYTLTLSALNTWTGEELRLTGLETAVTTGAAGGELQLAATAFGVNDTLGALLAWRGWTMNDRLTTLGELLPLPPLASFRPGGGFADQRDDGTRPFQELDGRVGWQARARWERPQRAAMELSYLDNRGDRELRHGQYSWATRFWTAGGEIRLGLVTLVGEAAAGETGMGRQDAVHVDMDFRAGYVLASWASSKARLTARYDRFKNVDRDGTAEPNDETGDAWTLAAFWLPVPRFRLGIEWLDLRADRPAAAASGANPNTNGRRLEVEARLTF